MRIILTTILMLVCLVAYSATPSYSNFSSNQFAPSGTYTVTVKDKPLLTNIVEHAQLSLTNPAFADSLVYMTNMRSLTGLTNTMMFVSTYGPKTQFAWTTNGIGLTNTIMVISNGLVGIGVAPLNQLHISGNFQAGGGVKCSGLVDVTGEGVRIAQAKSYAWVGSGLTISAPDVMSIALYATARDQFKLILGTNSVGTASSNYPALLIETNHVPGSTNLIYFTTAATNGASGCGIGLTAMYQDPTPYESTTNTIVYSRGTNLYIGDGITANSSNVATMQFSFQTSGTPVMVISNGLVGIGKANPGSALDVVGTINGSSDINPGGSSGIKFGANNDIAMSYSTDISGFMRHSALNGFQFKTFSGGTYNEKVRINTNGTVFFRASTVINSNEFPITANFANMTPCGCAFWMSNFTMYLICTNSADGNATTNKLGGL